MSQRKLPKPSIASFPFYKALLLAIFVSMSIFLLSAGFGVSIRGELRFTAVDVIVGIVSFGLGMSNWLAWQPRRSYPLRWLTVLIGNIYISVLLLLVSLLYWNALLNARWSVLVNSISVGLFVVAWFLPVLSPVIAKQLSSAQDNFSLTLLNFGGPAALMIAAGILGANFGMRASMDSRIIVLAFLFSLTSVGLAQYAANSLWPYRPWAKEDE